MESEETMLAKTATPMSEGKKVLLIEDNEDVRTAFRLILNHGGYDALVVSTAEEGLRAVKSHTYDIIICDYRLPGMDGLEFYFWAKPFSQKSIKVLISAFGFDDIVVNAKALGVEMFFQKPFSIPVMLTHIEKRASCRFVNLSVVGGGS